MARTSIWFEFMLRNRVLIITRGFPPYIKSIGGAVRMLKLAQFLDEKGAAVHVLAGRGREHGDFGYGDVLARLNVHYVDDPVLHRTSSASSSKGGAAAQARPSLAWQLLKAAQPAVMALAVPDEGVAALPRLVSAARRLVDGEGIETVVTSGPPHSDHLVGLLLKRDKPQLRWIVDYRDSWNGTSLFRKSFPPAQWLNARLERRILRAADAVIGISPPMLRKAARIAGLRADDPKFSLVMNGFDSGIAVDASAWRNDGGPLRIGYFGSIDDRSDSYRDPTQFFQAIIDHDLPVSFELFGQANLDAAWSTRLADRIRFHGNLAHRDAVQAMTQMDVLMLLHTRRAGADEVVTGKVFEYIASGRPVLSVGPAEMAVNAIFSADPAFHAVENDDAAALGETLARLIAAKQEEALPTRPATEIAAYSRERQYERFLTLLS